MHFYNTIEFYVIMAVVAAAVVAAVARPQTRHAVMEYLLGSRLSEGDGQESDPSLEFRCLDSGEVTLTRRGLQGVTMSGAVSLAVKSDGVNVSIEERLVEGATWDPAASEAVFSIDFLPPGRYHVSYNSDRTGLFAAFPLHVRAGIVARRELKR